MPPPESQISVGMVGTFAFTSTISASSLTIGSPSELVWVLARGALEAMIADQMALTPARKALLSQYDRQIKKIIYEGSRALQSDVPVLA